MSTPIKDDGGPAFPFKCQGPTTGPETYYGMSLRDWFAGMALQGLMRHPDSVGEAEDTIAAWSYAAADAMLERRKL
jgi:hypothetical protein